MTGDNATHSSGRQPGLFLRYRRRLIRKRLIWRAFRKRRELRLIHDNLSKIGTGDILCFSTIRNEATRLPYFLEHYRRLDVGHFIFVDNNSDDGSTDWLRSQPDVTLFHSTASYHASRFGVDWLNWLKWRFAPGHWVIVADADELLIYPDWDQRRLPDLTKWLEGKGHRQMGALMLDLYPKGPVNAPRYLPGQDPVDVIPWFDAHGYWAQRKAKTGALWVQGGPRARSFFEQTPERAPTLNKIPLVHWQRGDAFFNSTHSALPAALNDVWTSGLSGVLLHTKFLPDSVTRAEQEQRRGEHFQVAGHYSGYYDALIQGPDLWSDSSTRYENWQQLVDLGLMSKPDW